MKILHVSDHENSYIWDHFDPKRFEDIDLIISSGDLNPKYLSFLVTMIKAPLFYVHGNHDTSYAMREPLGCESIEDTITVYNGIRIVGLGGSQEYVGGPHQYTENQMARRIKKLNRKIKKLDGFDILVTHSPSLGLGDGDDWCHKGFESFYKLLNDYQPKYHLHGHQHLTYGHRERILKYHNTTVINGYDYHILNY